MPFDPFDPIQTAHNEQRRQVREVLDRETLPIRQVAGLVAVAAQDAVEGWASLAADLDRALGLTGRERERRVVRRAKFRARQLSKIAEALRGDVERLLALTDTEGNDGR